MLSLNASQDAPADLQAPRASSLRHPHAGARTEVDRVYDDIFDAVMDRRLLPGAKLTEATLCSVFDCTRATVRAALAQLALDKIVLIEPNRGAFVWQPQAKETRDVFAMRRALECTVVDMLLALPDLTPVGGSAAQREVVEETIVYCAVEAGRIDVALDLLGRRLDRRESERDRRRRATLPPPR